MTIGEKRSASSSLAAEECLEHTSHLQSVSDLNDDDDERKQFRYVYEKLQLDQLCPASDICAETFLTNLLKRRGYSYEKKPAIDSQYKRPITQREIQNYSSDLLNAIHFSDMSSLRNEYAEKKQIFACNHFGESTLHYAAKKSNHRVVHLILSAEDSPLVVDDFGRSPLCDALWAINPSFSVIEQILDHAIDLIYLTDVRGFTPLSYMRKENQIKLCLFFYSRREKYWPIQGNERRSKIPKH